MHADTGSRRTYEKPPFPVASAKYKSNPRVETDTNYGLPNAIGRNASNRSGTMTKPRKLTKEQMNNSKDGLLNFNSNSFAEIKATMSVSNNKIMKSQPSHISIKNENSNISRPPVIS